MTIRLLKLSLLNFKGVSKADYVFDSKYIEVCGANATGKTTIVDAYNWLLFGMDSNGSKDFDIKTIDPIGGLAIPKLLHEVTAVLVVDDNEISLSRTYKEKYDKNGEFTGHTTDYTWNEVAVTATEYSKRIAEIINLKIFKICTSATYFSSLPWADQLATLKQICNTEFSYMPDKYRSTIALLDKYKWVFEDIAKLFAKKISDIRTKAESLPAKIEESSRGILPLEELMKMETTIKNCNADIAKLENIANPISDEQQTKFDALQQELQGISKELGDKTMALLKKTQSESLAYEEKIHKIKASITEAEGNAKKLRDLYSTLETDLDANSKKRVELLERLEQVNSLQLEIDPNNYICPTCGQGLPDSQVSSTEYSLHSKFNIQKSKDLEVLNLQLSQVAANDKALSAKLENIETVEGEACMNELDKAKELLAEAEKTKPENKETTPEIETLKKAYEAKKKEVEEITATIKAEQPDNTIAINSLREEILAASTQKRQHLDALQRTQELQAEETASNNERHKIEKQQNEFREYEQAYKNHLVEETNKKFKIVTWRLFESNINGTLTPTCVPMVDKVPYSSLNTAKQINAGLDIIGAFSKEYNFYAPLFIDNRERVLSIIPMPEFQVINLKVTQDKTITIKKS